MRPAVNFFSSYLSEDSSTKCQLANNHQPCVEDAIPADAFFAALSQNQYFADIAPSSNQHDYELLVANEAAQSKRTFWQKVQGNVLGDDALKHDTTTYFTEVSVQWRGLEIHSELIELSIASQENPNTADLADQVLTDWIKTSDQQHIFSAPFLYSALRASDYTRDLSLPLSIGEFQNTDTQLYHDPFKGVISRYIHPVYENAVMDITVYPILQDISMPLPALLAIEIEEELQQAKMVAKARQTDLVVDMPPAPYKTAGNEGYRLALSATGNDGEPIFATSYVFRMKDKIVKFSGTFPPRIADDLVSQTLPLMRVPDESELMAELRQLASQQSKPQS